jgi:cobalamin synthase
LGRAFTNLLRTADTSSVAVDRIEALVQRVMTSHRWRWVGIALRVAVLVLGIVTLAYGQPIRGVAYLLVAIALFAAAFVKRRIRRGKVRE